MPSSTLIVISWLALGAAVLCALVILGDVFVRGHRQKMGVMEAVWPVTALYLGPIAWWGYHRFGRPMSPRWVREQRGDADYDRPAWVSTALGVSHCGAGCTLGDIIAEFTVFALGLTVVGRSLYAEFIGDFALALLLGIVFQYFAIAPMRGLGLRKGLIQAARADVLSLTAFEVGLFVWMALMYFVFFPAPHLDPLSPVYWFLMQIGMVFGFVTAWPMNVWLIRRGVKEAM